MEYKPLPDIRLLRELRIARSLSQDEVAEAIGTKANTISRWERGVAIPSPVYRRKLAELFQIDPRELSADLNDDEEEEKEDTYTTKEEARTIIEYLNLDITVTAGNFASSDHTGSRGKNYPVLAIFPQEGEASAIMLFPFDEKTLAEQLVAVEQAIYDTPANDQMSLLEREDRIQDFGQALFDALFCGRIRTLYETTKRGLSQTEERRLRIRLRIDPPELAALPWELMYDNDPEVPSYLCLDRSISLVRYQEVRTPYALSPVEFPLNILGMATTPRDREKLAIQSEKKAIKNQLKPLSRSVRLDWLSGSSWDDLRRAMARGPWHIFHFIGHGSFNKSRNEGFITLADANGKPVSVNARDLGLLLDHRSLRLVILNSYKGESGDRADDFSSTASVLARRNIPAIVAMQYKMTDEASIKFAEAFYGTLAKGEPIDAALFEARLALKGIPLSMEWAIPVLYMRTDDGYLFTTPAEVTSPSHADETTVVPSPMQAEARDMPPESHNTGENVPPRSEAPLPNDATIPYNQGKALFARAFYRRALGAYEQALRLDPNYASAYIEKGRTLLQLRRYQEALRACEQAIRLDPNYAYAYYVESSVLNALRRPDEAQQAHNKAEELEKNK